jgi:hypothetical protein
VSKALAEQVAVWANVATVFALLLNFIAILVAAWQLKAGRSGTSAGALIALNESFRQAWLRFTDATGEDHVSLRLGPSCGRDQLA